MAEPVANIVAQKQGVSGRPALTPPPSPETLKEVEAERKKADKTQTEPEILGLSAICESLWQDAKTYRSETGVGEQMIKSLRQRKGDYEPSVSADIEEIGGSDVFMGLTGVKCRAAEAWLHEVLNSGGDPSWKINPTPIPEISPEVLEGIEDTTMNELIEHIAEGGQPVSLEAIQDFASEMRLLVEDKVNEEAKERASRMQTVMKDQLIEGNWENAFDDFVSNMVTLKNGFIKGPIVRKKRKRNWVTLNGRTKPMVTWENTTCYEAPSPFDIYESRGMTDINNGTLIQKDRLSGVDLENLKGMEGYDANAIDACLYEYRQSGVRVVTEQDSERERLEDKSATQLNSSNIIESLEFWTPQQGKVLMDNGITEDLDGEAIKPLQEYDLNIIKIGKYIVYQRINDDPLAKRPYSKSTWAKVPGSFWGRGVPELMEDVQRICNASIRAMVNNQGYASGPQFVYSDITRLPAGEPIAKPFPGKIHQFNNMGLSQNEKPFYTVDIPSHAEELMGVYTTFANLADEYTGIPAYEHGQGTHVSGAGRTLGGLSMLMTNAARGIKLVIMRIDLDVVRTSLTRQYEHNMLYHPDESIKGDVDIVAEGTLAKIIKEQLMAKRMEFLQTTNNPIDQQLMGKAGRAEGLRETASMLDFGKSVVKTPEEVTAMENMEQVMQQRALEMDLNQEGQPVAA